jgi:hypothetical protein
LSFQEIGTDSDCPLQESTKLEETGQKLINEYEDEAQLHLKDIYENKTKDRTATD